MKPEELIAKAMSSTDATCVVSIPPSLEPQRPTWAPLTSGRRFRNLTAATASCK